MPPKTKTAFQLDSPYAESPWPQLNAQDQEAIIELLVNLLSPIGTHRKTHSPPSKGKRSKKRKRAAEAAPESSSTGPVPGPEISSRVLVGLNSVTRHLSSSSGASCPSTLPSSESGATSGNESDRLPPPHMDVLFTTRQPTPPLTSHLPMLCHTASLARPSLPATRLVVLPQKAEARLCEALEIARAGFIGLLDGEGNVPGLRALVELVREKVPAIETGKWLEDGLKSYKETRINAVQVSVPQVQKKK